MTEDEKLQLFGSLFRGRPDVYARRFTSQKTGKSGYSPVCANEWLKGVCEKPKMKCANCPSRQFVPLTTSVLRTHLVGFDESGRELVIGLYPILPDDTCWFVAADFDKDGWQQDAAAYAAACDELGIPVALERSRSGNGAHAWTFFDQAIPAALARTVASRALTDAMEKRPELGFGSYDRLFPNQDTMPQGGFGNLIALPLQGLPRKAENSVFIDRNMQPYKDQWSYLQSTPKMTVGDVQRIAAESRSMGRITGARLPVGEDDDKPWELPPSRQKAPPQITASLPISVEIVIGNQLYVDREAIPSQLVNRIIRLAAFQNPEFYRAQAMRMPTYNKPRIISCAELFPQHIALPRGCAQELTELLLSLQIRPVPIDKRNTGKSVALSFTGQLRPQQAEAVKALRPYDLGVLAAGTSFGKTVVAAKMIAARGVSTLVLVHRKQLLDQWRAALSRFLELPLDLIGAIGGGKRHTTGGIDVATFQSLYRKNTVDDLVANYGHIVVDECHHVSAVSFEQVLRQCKARYVLGLSATVTRKDGHQSIIFMQCGPVRFRASDREQAKIRPFDHKVVIRRTAVPNDLDDNAGLTQLYERLMKDPKRNDLIVRDILDELDHDRSPLILTERVEHLNILYDKLCGSVRNLIMLKGGMGKKWRDELAERMGEISDLEERVILATGKYIGEGFDDERLDTLFLTLPVSWKGTIAQYAGRLHRQHFMKQEVKIYDYADVQIPMAARMFQKRCKGYRAIGYKIQEDSGQPELF